MRENEGKCKLAVTRNQTCTHLAVGVVSQCLVCLIKHHTTDILRRTGPSCKIILHHLRCEEEHTSRPPLLVSISRGKVT